MNKFKYKGLLDEANIQNKNEIKRFINVEEFQRKILDFIGSKKYKEMVSCTVFADDPRCINAITHGLSLAAMLASTDCTTYFCEKVEERDD